MNKEIEKPPAFPTEGIDVERNGMRLRDYAQLKATQALIASNFITNKDGIPDVRYDYTELTREAKIYAEEFLNNRQDGI